MIKLPHGGPGAQFDENEVIDQLAATGQFEIAYGLICPDSGKRCKGLRMISKK